MRVNAFAATNPGVPLTPYEYEAGDLGPLEVCLLYTSDAADE